MDGSPMVETLVDLGALTLIHGTVLAGLTWLLCGTVLRRVRPAFRATLWTVVLAKFLVPPVLPGSSGLSAWLSVWIPSALTGRLIDGSAIAIETAAPGTGVWDRGSGGTAAAAVGGWPFAVILVYAVCLLLVLGRSLFTHYRRKKELRDVRPAGASLLREIEEISGVLGLRRVPRVRLVGSGTSPFVQGIRKPTLVIPEALFRGLKADARNALIAHELAHLHRGDLLIRLLQNVARTLLFFWPPVWWVCGKVEKFSEMACDQWAIQASGVSPGVYAGSLLHVVKQIAFPRMGQHELSFVRRGRLLEERFKMILNSGQKPSPGLTGLMFVALLVWISFAFAGGAVTAAAPVPQETQERKVLKLRLHAGESEVLPVDLLRKFPAADANSDGRLTTAELKAHLGVVQGDIGTLTVVCRSDDVSDEPACDFSVSAEPEAETRLAAFQGVSETILAKHPEADFDGDGTLSEAELKRFLGSSGGKKLVVERVRSAEDEAEITAFVADEGSERGEMEVIVSDGGGSSLLEDFPGADVDGDGSLSEEELSALREKLGAEGGLFFKEVERIRTDSPGETDGEVHSFAWTLEDGREVEMELRVAPGEMDLDGDGEVTLEEARTIVESQEGSAPSGRKHVIFIRAGTKELTEEEITAEREKMAEARRAQLLEKYPDADLNGDGRLDRDEAESLSRKLQELEK